MITYVSRYARYLEGLGVISGIFLIVLFLLKWTMGDFLGVNLFLSDTWLAYSYGPSVSAQIFLHSLPLTHRIAGFLVDGISVLLILLGFYYAIKIMHCFRKNEVFSLKTLSFFHSISKIAFAYALFSPIHYSLLCLVGSLHNPPGQRYLVIGLGTGDLINLLIFLFFLVITSVMKEGYQLQEEQNLTV